MKDAFYFKHDANAHDDPKITAMWEDENDGLWGYGLYWLIIENLRMAEDYKLPIKRFDAALAKQGQCDRMRVHTFLDACINQYELLSSDGNYIWSERLIRDMGKKNESAKNAANIRWARERERKKDTDACDRMPASSDALQIKEKNNNFNIYSNTKSKEIFSVYENNIGPVTSAIEADMLKDAVDRYPATWIYAAIEVAVKKRIRNLGYIEGILKQWGQNGIDKDNKPWLKAGRGKSNGRPISNYCPDDELDKHFHLDKFTDNGNGQDKDL